MRLPLVQFKNVIQVLAMIQAGSDEDPVEVDYGYVTTAGFGPYNHNQSYPYLFPDTPIYAGWPPGFSGSGVVFPAGSFYVNGEGPNFFSDVDLGVVSWRVRNRGHIPGKLQVAYWFNHQDPDTDEPDSSAEYTFGGGIWEAEGLRTHSITISPEDEGDPDALRAVGMRFFPGELRALA